MRRVVLVERRNADTESQWYAWGIYDSIRTVREHNRRAGRVVPVAKRRRMWLLYPWEWVDEYGASYRARHMLLVDADVVEGWRP